MLQTVLALFGGIPSFSFIDVLIFLNLYGLYLMPVFLVVGYFGVIRYFTFPLATRNPQELIVVASADRARFYKVSDHYAPMFVAGRGAYWFENPLTTEFDNNKLHCYIDGVNQAIRAKMVRNDNKLSDIKVHRKSAKKVKRHGVYLPRLRNAFGKNWAITIKQDGTYVYQKTDEKQPQKITPFVRVGIYLQEELEVEKQAVVEGEDGVNASSVASQTAVTQAVTMQTVLQQIGTDTLEQNLNFSASFAFDCIKMVKKLEGNFIQSLLGGIPPVILVVLIAVMGIIAMMVLMQTVFKPELPPPPPGVNFPG